MVTEAAEAAETAGMPAAAPRENLGRLSVSIPWVKILGLCSTDLDVTVGLRFVRDGEEQADEGENGFGDRQGSVPDECGSVPVVPASASASDSAPNDHLPPGEQLTDRIVDDAYADENSEQDSPSSEDEGPREQLDSRVKHYRKKSFSVTSEALAGILAQLEVEVKDQDPTAPAEISGDSRSQLVNAHSRIAAETVSVASASPEVPENFPLVSLRGVKHEEMSTFIGFCFPQEQFHRTSLCYPTRKAQWDLQASAYSFVCTNEMRDFSYGLGIQFCFDIVRASNGRHRCSGCSTNFPGSSHSDNMYGETKLISSKQRQNGLALFVLSTVNERAQAETLLNELIVEFEKCCKRNTALAPDEDCAALARRSFRNACESAVRKYVGSPENQASIPNASTPLLLVQSEKEEAPLLLERNISAVASERALSAGSALVPDMSVYDLLLAFGSSVFIDVVTAILLEKRIIFCSWFLRRLEIGIENFLKALDPLTWQGIYIPVLPAGLLDVVHAPMPFLVGIHTSCVPRIDWNVEAETVRVDLDAARFYIGKDSGFLRMPLKLRSKLENSFNSFIIETMAQGEEEREQSLNAILGIFFRVFTSEYLTSFWPAAMDKESEVDAAVYSALGSKSGIVQGAHLPQDEEQFWIAFGETQMKEQWTLRATVQHRVTLKKMAHDAHGRSAAESVPSKRSLKSLRASMFKKPVAPGKDDTSAAGSKDTVDPGTPRRKNSVSTGGIKEHKSRIRWKF
ncbi:Suppression of tumorigenicity 5 protein [Porphyridium purpureum]|uniref:Suppression of tumorigenicity 5 protein n=1 Tax=Porphyridium purpureum TaxID=35688 RepID=A0A5J4YIM4_PORPP|nr:Suppression of tumorigenicity 5 protein [Porphyridium purpureum]KAA8491260.1 Suppression of tumorigenicity 5 protein [Porphyridium purpureum]|eukprot:POR0305..scf289_17